MRRDNEQLVLKTWERSLRIAILSLLLLSAAQFLATAIVYRTLGVSEADTLIFAGCLVFSALAFCLALAFRKSGAPTWKHKLAVAILAVPAAITLALR